MNPVFFEQALLEEFFFEANGRAEMGEVKQMPGSGWSKRIL